MASDSDKMSFKEEDDGSRPIMKPVKETDLEPCMVAVRKPVARRAPSPVDTIGCIKSPLMPSKVAVRAPLACMAPSPVCTIVKRCVAVDKEKDKKAGQKS